MTLASERRRLQKLLLYEKEVRGRGHTLIAGVDEAGRGPLAGPVVAAACILPHDYFLAGVDDSKKLSTKQRFSLFHEITSDPEITYGVGIIDAQIIDEINILKATLEAMLLAVARLATKPDYILVDGPHLPPFSIPAQGIIGGDALSLSIAVASIIAKETRDQMMLHYHTLFPQYGFERHKGYCTEEHVAALKEHGPCSLHRKTFRWNKEE
ncbi:MAG: ribonuclease HII [Chlamydiales bacterium]